MAQGGAPGVEIVGRMQENDLADLQLQAPCCRWRGHKARVVGAVAAGGMVQ
jgi:hypothetical protein